MTGIEFIVRDRGGWTPPIQFPENNHPEFAIPKRPAPGKPLHARHLQYIKDVAGYVTMQKLADHFGVSRSTIHNIETGRTGSTILSRSASARQ